MSDITPLGIPLDDPTGLADAATFNSAMKVIDGIISGLKTSYPSTREEVHFYIDPVNGHDDDSIGSIGRPFKTWAGFMASGLLPKHTDRCDAHVHVASGNLDRINLYGYHASGGNIYIDGVVDLAALVVGPNTGTPTGGTDTRINLVGAGWVPGALAGKFYKIIDGTHSGEEGAILGNGADYFEVSGWSWSAYDVTDVFEIREAKVNVQTVASIADSSFNISDCSNVFVTGLNVTLNAQRYSSPAGRISRSKAVVLYNCSFWSSPAVGATSRLSFYVEDSSPVVAYATSFMTEAALGAGVLAGIMLTEMPGVDFMYSATNDSIYVSDGAKSISFFSFSQRLRTNVNSQNRITGPAKIEAFTSIFDMNGKKEGFRLESGPIQFEDFGSRILNSTGRGIYGDDYYAGAPRLSLVMTEISGNAGDGVNLGGGSTLYMSMVMTNPLSMNGGWGVKLRNGARAFYGFGDAIGGTLGAVNLGDGVTDEGNDTDAFNTTHQTRICAEGT